MSKFQYEIIDTFNWAIWLAFTYGMVVYSNNYKWLWLLVLPFLSSCSYYSNYKEELKNGKEKN